MNTRDKGTAMRKVILILAGLAAAGAAYWGYIRFSGSTTLEPPRTHNGRELELPATGDTAGRIGQTYIHGAEQSYYVTRDPETRQVTRVFGFSRLINPSSPSARWQVEKPYIIFYESAYEYRIDADNGLFQIERTGQSVVPQDGRLEGNVVIRVKPAPDSRVAETTILMDDLMFSSERTEFSTDGPVRAISSQVDLSGRGLVLMINAQDGQVEYLHILDLESLRLKNVVQAEPAPQPGAPSAGNEAASPSSAVIAQETQPSQPESKEPEDDDVEQSRLYQCVIEHNVVIRYGDRIVVGGADQVNIQNILFRSPDPDAPKQATAAESSAAERIDASSSTSSVAALPNQPPSDPLPVDPAPVATAPVETDSDDSRDVIVTCDGGIVIQPMNHVSDGFPAAAMAVEMNGAPLRIEQFDPQSPNGTLPLVHCGLLHYDISADVLKLFRGAIESDILLGGGSSTAGRIETQGPVVWDRKTHQAQIVGPGVVYVHGAQDDSTEAGRIAFAGQMELLFAEPPAQSSALELAAVNLTGGMAADLQGRGTLKTAADSAFLAFGSGNALTAARLEGAVRFENADAASPSSAAADTAVFHFDDQRQLARADLAGDVRLLSDSGHLQTEAAFIAFAADESGAVQPVRFETTTAAALETAESQTSHPPARFEARTIRYDLQTGSGRAVGPVRFVFYQQADPNSGLLTDSWPVEITADGDAEFIAGDDRQIETVIFNRHVNGVRTQQFAAYTQNDAFRCDTMVVTLGRDAADQTDIRQIVLRDGDVYAESIRTHETLKLAHIRLNCEQILFDRQDERLVAVGPGQIEVDNSKAESTGSADGIDLRGPSFARIEGFDRIEWIAAERRITAEGKADVLEAAYIPLIDGAPSRMIRAAGGRVEMDFADETDGRNRLVRLTARERVFFEERGKHLLEGYTLIYDVEADGWLSITGTENRPCMVNGARVPYIHYNLNTGQLETQLSTIPGAVPVP